MSVCRRRRTGEERMEREWEKERIPHDAIELQLRDLRALESVFLEGIANDILRRSLLELLDELVVDAFLDVDSRSGTAALAVVEEDAKVHPGDGVVDIRVVEDDVRALAAQLQGDLLQVRSRGRLHDLTAHDGAAGEGDLVDIHVRGDGRTGDLTEPGENVDDARWETGLFDKIAHVESGEGRLLGGLENDGVAAGDGGADFPRPHEEREVPWDDLTANTNLSRISA